MLLYMKGAEMMCLTHCYRIKYNIYSIYMYIYTYIHIKINMDVNM